MAKLGSDLDCQNSAKLINVPTPASSGDAATKGYVDGLYTNALRSPTALDCSGNPNYPASTAGDQYRVTVAGRIGGASGPVVEIGDIIACQTASASGNHATVGGNFYIVQSNLDQATTTTPGTVTLATQSEVNLGTDANKAVTPATLQTKLNNSLNGQIYTTTIGNGSNTSFAITHNLNNQNVSVDVRESNRPFAQVLVDIAYTDANNVTIGPFVNPPSNGQYTVMARL
jgi:hypothetical protein